MVVRISRGRYDPSREAEIRAGMNAGASVLVPKIQSLPGLIDYYVAIDSSAGVAINVSIWESEAHANRKPALRVMLDQRDRMLAFGMEFEPIQDHRVLWSV